MNRRNLSLLCVASSLLFLKTASAWTPLDVDLDPLVRMPGTQPSATANIASPSHEVKGDDTPKSACVNCHKGDPEAPSEQGMPFFQWQGSMMAQAARDPVFWATLTVAAQDSIWAVGRPNATDICLRCHFPEGWMSDRSGQLNGSAMTGSDFDGVHCAACHRMYDPFYKTTNAGTREGGINQQAYWDEATLLSSTAADSTALEDAFLAGALEFFNGTLMYNNDEPVQVSYTENGGGQMFMDLVSSHWANMRGPFADPEANAHQPVNEFRYSRYHKSKFFCSTCHDVSNPVLENLGQDGAIPLNTEVNSAHTYQHVERTFSEFMSSVYSQDNGFPTNQEFQDQGGTGITIAAKCQDCHMADIDGVRAASGSGVVRPDNSSEHIFTGVPAHNLQGGNMWITYILASLDESLGSIYDTTNVNLLDQGPATLTLDLSQGISPMDDSNGGALLAASERAKSQLLRAATIKNISYNSTLGILSFHLQNNTGHKLITGYPEGRRMFLNIKAFSDQTVVYEINPYDNLAGTFKGGLSFWNYNGDDSLGSTVVPAPAALGINEEFKDDLVYEAVTQSTLTGEDHTFHFALATGSYKDNRIPPKFFNLSEAKTRLCEPVASGGIADDPATPETNLYSTAEYAGGFDAVTITIPEAASRNITHMQISLYYQGTSREYIEFLRDEIKGTGINRALYGPDNIIGPNNTTYFDNTASAILGETPNGDNAYLIQSSTQPSATFFSGLKAWGDTIWQLWYHNHGLDGSSASVDGIVPFKMFSAQVAAENTAIYTIELTGNGIGQIQDTVSSTVLCDKTSVAPTTCNIPYIVNTNINYTAVPGAGSSFAGFSGSAQINGNQLTDTITTNETIQAAFMVTVPGTVLYTIEMTGDGIGYIQDIGSGDTLCNKTTADSYTCSLPYVIGTEIGFRAIKGEESLFTGFSGNALINDNELFDTITTEETIQATFIFRPNMNITLRAAISIAADKGNDK